MKKNIGTLERIIRVIIASAIGASIYLGYIDGTLAIVLGILAGIMLLTSIFAFCPLYLPFNISTIKK
jgi:hypothetical protein